MRLTFKTAIATAVAIPSLAVPATAGATTLLGSGSSAEQPILTALFAKYHKLHPSINFKYNPDGGNAGVKDVQDKHSQFAINTRAPLPSDTGTTQYKLYLDGLCVAVNKSNKLTNLSIAQTRNIFLARSTSWSAFGSSGLTSTIDPIGRDSAAGSYTFFQKAILDGATQASSVEQLSSDGLVATAVKKDPNAIGYVGLANSTTSGIKTIKIAGVACSHANIKSQKYVMSRYIWGVLPKSNPSAAVESFIDWLRTSAAAGTVINASGAVAAFNK